MEVSALKYSGGVGLHGRSPLLRMQSDERLVALVRRGNEAAFEVLVARYEARLLAFCRHLLGSREDAEDVLQEALAAAYNALLADERPIHIRPWLYRIARNRSLNHLRRARPVGVDSMDVHLFNHGASTADEAHDREAFRHLIADIRSLPETQRTALVLREMEALSYEQIAEAMETTVSSIKSLLVRARISLAEAAEARMITCDEVRNELGEAAEGLKRHLSSPVRRHLRTCERCAAFRVQLRQTNRALAALLPLGPMVVLRKLLLTGLSHHAGSSAAGSGATAAAGSSLLAGSSAGGLLTAGVGALATKAAAGLAAAALLTAAGVEVAQPSSGQHRRRQGAGLLAAAPRPVHAAPEAVTELPRAAPSVRGAASRHEAHTRRSARPAASSHPAHRTAKTPDTRTTAASTTATRTTTTAAAVTQPGRTDTQTSPTVLPSATSTEPSGTATTATTPPPGDTGTTPTGTTPTGTTPTRTTPTGTTPTGTTPTGTTPTGTTPTGTTPTSTTPTGTGTTASAP